MSGGGSLGAYEAGALYGIYHELADKSKMEYDVVTGVSVGAINSAAVVLFGKGDEGTMVDWLTNLWQNIDSDTVYKNWPVGIV